MCITIIKRLFARKETGVQNEKDIVIDNSPLPQTELTVEQFNVLNNLPKSKSQAQSLFSLSPSGIGIAITKETIDAIKKIWLTSDAASWIDDKDNSEGRIVELVREIDDRYFVTEEGKRYIEYWIHKNNIVEAEKL